MTITGEDVRRARGSESRKSFSQRVGITEAKIAGIEKGRKIRPDEIALLEAAGITGGNGSTPLLDRAGVTEVTNTKTDTVTNVAPVSQVKAAPRPRRAGKEPPPIELLDMDTDLALDTLEDDAPFGLITVEPLQPPKEKTFRELAPDGARLVSNSEIQTYKRCKRKWYLSFYQGLRRRDIKKTGHLQVGTKAHAALAEYYTPEGQPSTDPRDALERILVEAWTDIEAEVEDELVLQTIAADFKKDANLLRAMIEGYIQWLEETGSDEDLEVIAPEESLVLPFPVAVETATPVFITGRLDVRLRRRSDGARLFMDHKTVGDFTKPGRWLHMNPQMRHYHLLEVMTSLRDRIEAGDGIHYEVERTDGALYNMLRKVLRTERANPPFYQRLEVRHNKHDLAAYERQLRGIIQEMLQTQTQLDAGYDHQVVAYPTPNDTCAWSCDFFAVCPMHDDGSRYQQMLDDVYEVHDPYDRYPELMR